jgi:hypothetical protein
VTDFRRALVCHDQCVADSPAITVHRTTTLAPSRLALIADRLASGALSWDLDVARLAHLALTSDRERESCICGLDLTGLSWSLRAEAARRDLLPDSVRAVRRDWEARAGPFALAESPRPDGPVEVVHLIDSVALWLAPDSVRAAERLLPSAASVHATAGFELYDLGLVDEARTALAETIARLRALPAVPVVTVSPGAVLMLTEIGPRLGLEPVEAMPLVSRLETRPAVRPQVVTFHDSSLLGRRLGVLEPPRCLLRALGHEVVEMRRTRERAWPSGPRLGYPDPDAARAMAAARVEEAVATGARILVTASPQARHNLAAVGGIEVRDVVELVAEAFGEASG